MTNPDIIATLEREWLGATLPCVECGKGIRSQSIGIRLDGRLMHERCFGPALASILAGAVGIDVQVGLVER